MSIYRLRLKNPQGQTDFPYRKDVYEFVEHESMTMYTSRLL